jgi:hypothetical protein
MYKEENVYVLHTFPQHFSEIWHEALKLTPPPLLKKKKHLCLFFANHFQSTKLQKSNLIYMFLCHSFWHISFSIQNYIFKSAEKVVEITKKLRTTPMTNYVV